MICATTYFKHPKTRLWTHRRPNGNLEQLDHILVNSKWINSIRNCRAYNTVEVNSDHRILSTKLQISLQAHKKRQPTNKKCWEQLRDINKSREFNNKFKTNYQELLQSHDVNNMDTPQNLQNKYDAFVQAITTTAKETIPKKQRTKKHNPVSQLTECTRKLRNQPRKSTSRILRN